MDNIAKKIKTFIIDHDEEAVFDLKEHLSFFPEIDIKGSASKYKNVISFLSKERIDVLFLAIEMPERTGFELLRELRREKIDHFKVIFYTAYDQYVLQALREAAFDYILKPVVREDLKNTIERFKSLVYSVHPVNVPHTNINLSESISLPAPIGLKFLDKNYILMFQNAGKIFEKKCWIAILTDRSQVKLRYGTSAKDILEFAGLSKFIRLNQSLIVNLNYLFDIEYKTRICHLIPPFNDIPIIASRANMSEIKRKFERQVMVLDS